MKTPMMRGLLPFSALLVMSCQTEPLPPTDPTNASGLANAEADNAAAYPADLRSICHAHEIAKIPPEQGFAPVQSWLARRMESGKAAQQLRMLWTTDPIEWMQALRLDALGAGVSPCPLADTWERALRRSWPVAVTPQPGAEPPPATAPAVPPATSTAVPSASTAPEASPAAPEPALDQPGCPRLASPPYPAPAREAKVDGLVIARCIVEPDGFFGGCRLLRSHPMFDSTIKLHLAGAHVTPFTVQGRLVRVACNYPFRFKVEH